MVQLVRVVVLVFVLASPLHARPPPPSPPFGELASELPLMATLESVRVLSWLYTPPPGYWRPPVIVTPDSASDPASTLKTRPPPPPLTVSSLAPGPSIVVVALPVNWSAPLVRAIVCGLLNRLEKTIVSPPQSLSAWMTAARSEPGPLS